MKSPEKFTKFRAHCRKMREVAAERKKSRSVDKLDKIAEEDDLAARYWARRLDRAFKMLNRCWKGDGPFWERDG